MISDIGTLLSSAFFTIRNREGADDRVRIALRRAPLARLELDESGIHSLSITCLH